MKASFLILNETIVTKEIVINDTIVTLWYRRSRSGIIVKHWHQLCTVMRLLLALELPLPCRPSVHRNTRRRIEVSHALARWGNLIMFTCFRNLVAYCFSELPREPQGKPQGIISDEF